MARTFEATRDAERTLSVVETQLIQDDWTDPKRGTVTFGDSAQRWITQRPSLRPSTVQLYHQLPGYAVSLLSHTCDDTVTRR